MVLTNLVEEFGMSKNISTSQKIKWAFERAKKEVIVRWGELAQEVKGLFEQLHDGDLTKADIHFMCNDLLALIKCSYDHTKTLKRRNLNSSYNTQIHPGLVKILCHLPQPLFNELISRLGKYDSSRSDYVNAVLKSLSPKIRAQWKEALQQERIKQRDIGLKKKEQQTEKVHSNTPAVPVKKSQEFDPRQLTLISIAGNLAVVEENSVLEFIQAFKGALKKERTIAEIIQYGRKLSGSGSLDDVVSGWESGQEDNFTALFIPNFKVRHKPISHINTIYRPTWADGYRAAGAHHLFIFRISRNDYATCDQWLSNNSEQKLYVD